VPPFLRHDMFGPAQQVKTMTPVFGQSGMPKEEEHSSVMCGICQDSVPPMEAFALNCRHWFCTSCWEGYIHNAINERQVTYCCPFPDCKYVVTRDMQDYLCDEPHAMDAKNALIK